MKMTKGIFLFLLVLLPGFEAFFLWDTVRLFIDYPEIFKHVTSRSLHGFYIFTFLIMLLLVHVAVVFAYISSFRRLKDVNRMVELSNRFGAATSYNPDDVVEYIDLSISNFKRNIYWIIVLFVTVVLAFGFDMYDEISRKESGFTAIAVCWYLSLYVAFVIRGVFSLIFSSSLDKFIEQLYQCDIKVMDSAVFGMAFTKKPNIFTIFFGTNKIENFRFSKPFNGTINTKYTDINGLNTGRTLEISHSGKSYVLMFCEYQKAFEIQKSLVDTKNHVDSVPPVYNDAESMQKCFCQYCGQKLEPSAAFCGRCGKSIK